MDYAPRFERVSMVVLPLATTSSQTLSPASPRPERGRRYRTRSIGALGDTTTVPFPVPCKVDRRSILHVSWTRSIGVDLSRRKERCHDRLIPRPRRPPRRNQRAPSSPGRPSRPISSVMCARSNAGRPAKASRSTGISPRRGAASTATLANWMPGDAAGNRSRSHLLACSRRARGPSGWPPWFCVRSGPHQAGFCPLVSATRRHHRISLSGRSGRERMWTSCAWASVCPGGV
jgi:hypothetical protein